MHTVLLPVFHTEMLAISHYYCFWPVHTFYNGLFSVIHFLWHQ